MNGIEDKGYLLSAEDGSYWVVWDTGMLSHDMALDIVM